MAQDHQEHPTLEQLSAYLDGALSSEEQAFCASHVPYCSSCRSELASLSLTRDWLRALPRATPPRAFTLTPELLSTSSTPEKAGSAVSENAITTEAPVTPLVSAVSAAPTRQPQPSRGARARRLPWRRAVRMASALAAVIALALLLSGLLPALRGNVSTSMSTALPRPTGGGQANSSQLPATAVTGQQQSGDRPPHEEGPRNSSQPNLVGTAGSTGSSPSQQLRSTPPGPALSFNLALPETRLLLAGLLLAVSLVGLLVTRRARSSP
ncbi:MAG: zf-HC2 domain-containing protein [Thermogemmatispora sp.]|uniref:anti-sigma factor family protein n=1 Tax=Thermogemmatispora sp. TaxID=1968838 RepID=UPI001D60B92E|nr:zf-HC2 domain-containing protein [Thermogemmatispora sp.]MBX5451673.1 zf-HC2 domain-containing protein [Thermogemmatispora sp.]